jgi:flagellar biosynthetic protein FliQ
MDADFVLYLGRRTLEVGLMMAAPALATALGVGLLTALFQAVTSIRDMTLGMVLKVAGVGTVAMIFGGWMLEQILSFTMEVFHHMQSVTR